MKKIIPITAVLALFAGVFGSCEKAETSTTFSIIPMVEDVDKKHVKYEELTAEVKTFMYFYSDTSQLKAGTFDETMQGIMYDKATGAAVDPNITGVAADSVFSMGPIDRASCVIMCVYADPDYEIYAVRKGAIKENLSSVQLRCPFRLWETNKEYTVYGWKFYYGNPYVVPEPEPVP